MKFFKYTHGDFLKLSPILYNGEFVNSIPFISFYGAVDKGVIMFRSTLNSKYGEILNSFRVISMRQEQQQSDSLSFVEKCVSSIESNGEKFFIILPISVHYKLSNISFFVNNYLHVNTDYKIVETDEIKDINKIEESKYDIDDWFGTYKNNEKMLDFFKNNYKEIYLKYIENEREYKLNYLLEK